MTIRLSLAVLILLGSGTSMTLAQTRRTTPPPRPATRAATPRPPAPPVADVKLDALKATRAAELPPTARNPFRFNEGPVAVAGRPDGSRAARGGPAPPLPAGPVGPPPPPPLPPIQLRFIGLIEAPQQAGRVALLSDGKGGLMNGREGDIIEGRYRVLRVGPDSLDLAYADGRGRQTIRLSGQ
jgi:hypothetical protein